MKHVRCVLPLAIALFVVTLAARPCGPDFPSAIFVLQTGPGGNYANYAAGHIGVPQSAYRTRHLVIAYAYLNGHTLPPEVQKEAVALNTYFLNPWQADNTGTPRNGLAAWVAERTHFGPVDGYTPSGQLATDRPLPGQEYSDFNNCLDNAFATAAGTLTARIAAHSTTNTGVIDWVRAQDAVFTNCGDGKAPRYFGPPEKALAPPPAPHAPTALPAGAPLWLRQDRAYQLAAASFYHLDFEDALSRFHAIATDTASPWSMTARYLIARAYARKASIEDGDLTLARVNKDKGAAAARYKATMKLAQSELLAMQSDPRMAPMRRSIDGLLDYVDLRLQPQEQAAVLANRLQSSDPVAYRQAVIDLTWLHSNRDGSDTPAPMLNSVDHPNDQLAWIDAIYSKDEAAALKRWRSTHSAAWLVAALSNAKVGDPAVPELLQAASAVSQTSAGWLAITYNRLRLSPQDAAMRKEALAVLAKLDNTGDVSTTNLFLAMTAATAPTLDAWLMAVPRTPAGSSSYEEGEDVLPGVSAPASDAAAPGTPSGYVEDACGKRFPAKTVLPLFDTDAAVILNRDMPLRVLAQAAESSVLPQNLRFQVAQAAWTRAVLLEQPAIAQRMTPLLVGCRAAWKPVLAAYDSATTADARNASGLLALMRFASTVPSVWEGEDRRSGFATYDEFRENWWCTTVPKPGETVDFDPDPRLQSAGNATTPPSNVKVPTPPSFLNQNDLAEAHAQVAALEQIPRASTYFAQHALAWQKLHPSDPQTPDILGEADRVIRNSCRKDPPYEQGGKAQVNPADMTLTSNLAKTLFETLQSNYPDSPWAKRYTSWQ